MNFDDINKVRMIDQDDMYSKIYNFPEQIKKSWDFVNRQNYLNYPSIKQVIVAGVAYQEELIDLLMTMNRNQLPLEMISTAKHQIPLGCFGKDNLIIVFIDENNSMEMQQLAISGLNKGCSIIVLTNKEQNLGDLKNEPIEFWIIDDIAFNRTTIGYSTFLLYGVLYKAGLVSDLSDQLPILVKNLQNTVLHVNFDIPSMLNPAKRLAGQMVGRWVKIIAGGHMITVAQRWSSQINQNAKALATHEDIHYLANYSLSGIYNPVHISQQSMVIFLKSSLNDDDIEMLVDKAKEELMCNGLGTDIYVARGNELLSQIWTTILFGDFVSFYLAIAYECDPSPIANL